ncbi:type II toxin-antitoxin system RelE/ParE family toxin [Pedobacter helvus]|uniref:Type II toxin-antitoxin system RelE/ParE family toxin n=1 Tax=Pedobacter helvus TaxID=2563444 RepID=A0ABW9JQI9_9SPHI|nr:hypothetical protein [Pedobacter ureilyticus]
MSFALKFGSQAGITYQAITAQLYERWSEKVVLSFEGKVKKYLKILIKSPYLYQIIDDELQLRKCVVHKNCSILYKIYEHDVLIVCFWDNRQDAI